MFLSLLFYSTFSLVAAKAWAAPLICPSGPFPFQMRPEASPLGDSSVITFASALKSRFKPDNTVWAHYRRARGSKPAAAVLVLPVMGAPNFWIENQFIRRFHEDGLAVLLLETPYQFHRRPSPLIPSGQVFLARNPKILAFNFRQSVADACRALAWLKRRPEINPEKIGLFGISLGSLVGASVYSVSPVPRYAVLLLGGADLPSLVFHSAMTRPFVQKIGVDESGLREIWSGIDAVDYRDENAEKPVLLINASSDKIIPRENALKLKWAFPKSRQIWVPFGHYSSIVHLLWLPRYVSRAFLDHLSR